jgi:DNA-binding response OmpR family regulator
MQFTLGLLFQASTSNTDIVLLDLGPTDMDGLEMIEKWWEWSTVPVIVSRQGSSKVIR